MKRFAFILLALLLAFSVFPFAARAEGESAKDAVIDALPEELRDLFLRGGELTLPDLSFFTEGLSRTLSAQLKESGADLMVFFGGIILCSIFSLLNSIVSGGRDGPLRLCLLLFGCLSVFAACKGIAVAAKTHLEAICRLITAMTPAVTAAAIAMGGLSSAAVSSAALCTILSFIAQFSLGVLFPLQRITLALDLCSSAAKQRVLAAFSKTLRGFFLFVLGTVGAVISAVFALQNTIASKSDGVALRAFRFTAGNAVPMVGGLLSETSKTLLSGLSLIKSTVGAIGALTVLLLFLPNFILLFSCRAVLRLCASLSRALDASPLDALYDGGAAGAGMLCAIVAISDLCCFSAFAAFASAAG